VRPRNWHFEFRVVGGKSRKEEALTTRQELERASYAQVCVQRVGVIRSVNVVKIIQIGEMGWKLGDTCGPRGRV
jgi:hypothetical protein